ncbi:MAG: GFA family protein [Pseudomonadota bacterium]
MSLQGGCLCGAVTYEVTGPLRPAVACHCGQCRKTSGHHVVATSAAHEDVAVAGEVHWYRSSETAERGFCPVCGSNLFWRSSGGARLSIFMGTFDGETGLSIAGHIFVADKGDYYTLDDDLPKALGADPDLTTAR